MFSPMILLIVRTELVIVRRKIGPDDLPDTFTDIADVVFGFVHEGLVNR